MWSVALAEPEHYWRSSTQGIACTIHLTQAKWLDYVMRPCYGKRSGYARVLGKLSSGRIFMRNLFELFVMLVLVWPHSQAFAQAPHLEIPDPIYRFGQVNGGDVVTHAFILRNVGNGDLMIQSVKPSCGCTVVDLSDSVIHPRSEAVLRVKVTVDPRWKGVVEKSVDILSNNPKSSRTRLVLEGEAIPLITVKPDGAFLGSIPVGTIASQVIEISAAREDCRFQILDVRSDSPQIKVEKQVVTNGRIYRLHVRIQGTLPEGDLKSHVYIKTNNATISDFTIIATATIAGDLAISPRKILLSTMPQPVTRYIVISSGAINQFKIERVITPLKTIHAEVKPIGNLGYRIRLTNIVASDDLKGKEVKIVTDAPHEKEILIPFELMSPTHNSSTTATTLVVPNP